MNFLKAAHTDVGIKKSTNQDSVLIREAKTDCGQVLLAAICDGMGGLAKGEVASASVIDSLSKWFLYDFPELLYSGLKGEELLISLENFIYEMNNKIQEYSKINKCTMGTTIVALVIVDSSYYVINVGDSRVYKINDTFEQITKDQTYVQREIDLGNMTPEQAKNDPNRNVLLQCIGASSCIIPDFYQGTVNPGDVFMLCSDGFRHLIEPNEFYQYLSPYALADETQMRTNIEYFVELNKYRQEEDNISVALIKTY